MAFVNYGIVIATLCGPVIVSCTSWWFFSGLIKKQQERNISKKKMCIILAAPWLLGLFFAAIVQANDELGSFRGLYCYAKKWEKGIAGPITLSLLICSCSVTALAFWHILGMVQNSRASIGSALNKQSNKSQQVLKKGMLLVSVLVFTWSVFAVGAFLSTIGVAVPIFVESIGGIMVCLQPIIDYFVVKRSLPSLAHGKTQVSGKSSKMGRSRSAAWKARKEKERAISKAGRSQPLQMKKYKYVVPKAVAQYDEPRPI